MIHSLPDVLMYPPKMYFPTRTMVTVGPLLSHLEWKIEAAQPFTDARQQRCQKEDWVCSTDPNQNLNGAGDDHGSSILRIPPTLDMEEKYSKACLI